MSHGKSQKQAIAIAYSQARKSKNPTTVKRAQMAKTLRGLRK